MIKPFKYTVPAVAPEGYTCFACDARGVKLWREGATFLEGLTLACAACSCAEIGISNEVGADGRRAHARTDQIGRRVPAVPTEDGASFWGYTSVPDAGVVWWRSLPTREVPERIELPESRADRACRIATDNDEFQAVMEDLGQDSAAIVAAAIVRGIASALESKP